MLLFGSDAAADCDAAAEDGTASWPAERRGDRILGKRMARKREPVVAG